MLIYRVLQENACTDFKGFQNMCTINDEAYKKKKQIPYEKMDLVEYFVYVSAIVISFQNYEKNYF